MIAVGIQVAAPATPAFDAWAWLNGFTAIGGGYILHADRSLSLLIRDVTGGLEEAMGQIVQHPERVEAIKVAIERRQIGEIAA